MNKEPSGFIKTDLREACYMAGGAGLAVALVAIYTTQAIMLIGAAVIGMTLGKLLARILLARSKS